MLCLVSLSQCRAWSLPVDTSTSLLYGVCVSLPLLVPVALSLSFYKFLHLSHFLSCSCLSDYQPVYLLLSYCFSIILGSVMFVKDAFTTPDLYNCTF